MGFHSDFSFSAPFDVRERLYPGGPFVPVGSNPITGTPTRGRSQRIVGPGSNINPALPFPSFPFNTDPLGLVQTNPEAFTFNPGFGGANFQGLGERASFASINPDVGGLLGGTVGAFSVPDTFAPVNPEQLAAVLLPLDPVARGAEVANINFASVAEAKTLAGQAAGISTFEEAINRVLARETAFQQDPNRLALTEALAARSGPDARVFSQAQEATLLNTIAQTASTAASRRLFSSGGQGGPGTASSAAQATADAISASQGVAAVANIDAVNEAARGAALGDAAAFQVAEDRVGLEITRLVTVLEGGIASIQAGNEFVPFDQTAFIAMDFAFRQYEDFLVRSDEAQARVEEAAKFGPIDVLQFGLGLVGQGLL